MQIGSQLPANETDETVVVCLIGASVTPAPHPQRDLLKEM
jgi:hypothetical protein